MSLPAALVAAMNAGRWKVPSDLERFQKMFPLERLVRPSFYDIDGMRRENVSWYNETLGEYLGEPDGETPPGDIDPHQSVLIADLGPDLPIALDYRKSTGRPRVLYLTGDTRARWVEAAPDIETLLRDLDL